jgi:hypothetical protein
MDRRNAFKALAVAGVSSGALTSCMSAGAATGTSIQSAGFGWEIPEINNTGADISFRVERAITLLSASIDAAMSLTSPFPNPAFTEVLCLASISRGGPPTINGNAGYFDEVSSPTFAPAQLFHGDIFHGNQSMLQDRFYSVILKAFAPYEGSSSRHVTVNPNLAVDAGDYLIFHMDHAGYGPMNCEMQVVLSYLASG